MKRNGGIRRKQFVKHRLLIFVECIHTVESQHMKVNIEIERVPKSLNKCDSAIRP